MSANENQSKCQDTEYDDWSASKFGLISMEPSLYYVSNELGGWGQKNGNFADVQYYLC